MWSPEQVLQYERQYNDAMRGQQADRQAARFLPPGVEPVDGDVASPRWPRSTSRSTTST
jgi:hypothetical protein